MSRRGKEEREDTKKTVYCIFALPKPKENVMKGKERKFRYTVDTFADLKVIRYRVPGWENLTPRQRCLLYYLSEAANWGRDILFDQNFRYNLLVKRVLEKVCRDYAGERKCKEFEAFTVYLKRFWFSNGIHHHYACDKFLPACPRTYMKQLLEQSCIDKIVRDFVRVRDTSRGEGLLSDLIWEETRNIATRKDLISFILKVIYDADFAAKRVNLDAGAGLLEASACHYYAGVDTAQAEKFYDKQQRQTEKVNPEAVNHPVSYGLNSRLEVCGGKLRERVCCIGEGTDGNSKGKDSGRATGLYRAALEKICRNLEKAIPYAENVGQKKHLQKLIAYYHDGDLRKWDEYSILWVQDVDSSVDYTNGFIETYGDPLGLKASWEALTDFRDEEATGRTAIISRNAQWFENHSPVDARFKKEKVKGVSAKVITAVQLGGDCFPSSPIGINLPNADWIRHEHGSKSVTIGNLCDAYDGSAKEKGGMLQEFAFDEAEVSRIRAYGSKGSNLHTDLHECLGHGSGKLLAGVSPDALKNYASTLEEARADLFALYYLADPKMRELGLVESEEVYKAEYDSYMRNGLMTQLVRIELGRDIEEAHMRNRSLVARWAFEKGQDNKVTEWVKRGGKTYVHIHDYEALRGLFAELLAEVQRIKSEGDFEAGRELVERYGVKIDRSLHKEVLRRYKALNLAAYGGFVNPRLRAVKDEDGAFADVSLSYPRRFDAQMLDYARRYTTLPILN